jgi:hypothetical protein
VTIDPKIGGPIGRGRPPAPRFEAAGNRIERGALVREARTRADYRLYALPNTKPAQPGLLRVAPGQGAEIEVWSLAPAAFGSSVAAIPPPLGIGARFRGRDEREGVPRRGGGGEGVIAEFQLTWQTGPASRNTPLRQGQPPALGA